MNNRFFAYAEIFVTVVRCNSITLAAEELKTSKSNVSQKLSDFEALLDLKLLSRTTRQMGLTPAGEQIYKTCREAVDATTRAASEIYPRYDSNTHPNGKVTISGSNIYLTNLVLPKVHHFLEKFPDIKLVCIGSDRRVDFAAEDVDLGIRIGPVLPGNYMSTAVQPLKRILCASSDFLDAHEVPTHPRDLLHMPCIYREQEKPAWKLQNGNETHEHRIRNPKITVNTIEMAHAAAVGGLGLCVLASLAVDKDILRGRLRRVLPEWEVSSIPVTLLCRPSRLLKPQVSVLHRYLVSELSHL